jgi:two-component system cell cycle response regulator DivK
MNILYIEDNKINQIIVQKNLEKDHSIDIATTPNEGLEMVKQKDYDVFLIDINLNDPEVYGFTIMVQLKKLLSNKKRAYIALTNYSGEDWEKNCLEVGFDSFMTKPFDLEAFNSFLSTFFA